MGSSKNAKIKMGVLTFDKFKERGQSPQGGQVEVLGPALKEIPALAVFQFSTLPVNLLTDALEAGLLKNIEKPVLLSDLRDQNFTSLRVLRPVGSETLREVFPDPNPSSLPQPTPLFFDSETISIRLPIQTAAAPLIQAETPTSAPAPSPDASTTPVLDKPRLTSHTPLVWDALRRKRSQPALTSIRKKNLFNPKMSIKPED